MEKGILVNSEDISSSLFSLHLGCSEVCEFFNKIPNDSGIISDFDCFMLFWYVLSFKFF